MPRMRGEVRAVTLHLAWAGYDAAKFACTNWHYSRSLPSSRLMIVGVWESGEFKGVVTFSRGATPRIGSPYNLTQMQVCELTRVALRDHVAPVSRIVAIALRMVRRKCPDLQLVISYAAGEHGHHGGIYQAGGWIYEGPMESHGFMLKGRFTHCRSIGAKYGPGTQTLEWVRKNLDPAAEKLNGLVRHKYLMPLTAGMRAQVLPLSKAYPRRSA